MKRHKIKNIKPFINFNNNLLCIIKNLCKQNPFSNLVLTSIQMETNIDGEKLSKVTLINSKI